MVSYVEGCCLGDYLLLGTKELNGNEGVMTKGRQQRGGQKSRGEFGTQEVIGNKNELFW